MSEVFTTYPPYYSQTREIFKVNEEGKSKFGDFISKEEFEKHLGDEARQDDKVVEILDILGVFCHFKRTKDEQDDELEKMYVLNPEWLTKGVYKILSSYILAEKRGRVELSDIKRILNRSEYEGKHYYIIKLMHRFKLCFKTIEKQKEYIIFPTWLPIEESGLDFFSTNVTSFDYKYASDSEMEKAITTFIVENHKGSEENKFWRRGILLQKKNKDGKNVCRILVKADVKSETITITVEGEKSVRESHIAETTKYFNDYHQENNVQVIEGKSFEIEKLEAVIEKSNISNKHLLAEIPKLENQIAVLTNKIQNIKPILKGFEALEKFAELEKVNSKIQGVKDERVKKYELYLIAVFCILLIGYTGYYVANWQSFKQKFQDWEHFTVLGLTPVLLFIPILWQYRYKNIKVWEKIVGLIENKVSNNLKRQNTIDLETYSEVQDELEKLKPQIEKAKSELRNLS